MKTICVPKNQAAQKQLDFDQCKDEDLIELNLNESVLANLFEIGFFKSMNNLTNSNIDDFEDERIVDLNSLQKVLNSNIFTSLANSEETTKVISAVRELFIEALSRKTGIYFYF